MEDTCQCLEAIYLKVYKFFKAKEDSLEICYLLIAWKILYLWYISEPEKIIFVLKKEYEGTTILEIHLRDKFTTYDKNTLLLL